MFLGMSGLFLGARPRVPGIAQAEWVGSPVVSARLIQFHPLTPIRDVRATRPVRSAPVAATVTPVAVPTIINAIALIATSRIPTRRMLTIAAELAKSELTASITPGGVPLTRTSRREGKAAMESLERVQPLVSRRALPSSGSSREARVRSSCPWDLARSTNTLC